jgi:predicted nucleic acid-binding protein
MKLVIDANIFFAALIKEGSTAELLISDKLQLFAPELLFIEFIKYEELILKKTHRSREEFNLFLELLKEQIIIVPKKEIIPFMNKAEKISPDPRDTVYLALAFALKSSIWSNDKRLKQGQNKITVFSTEELLEKTNLLKT